MAFLAFGLTAGWLSKGGIALIPAGGVVVAGANGYSKAYSP